MDLKTENEWLWLFIKTVAASKCRCGYPPNDNGVLCEACIATQMLDARGRHLTNAMHSDGEGDAVYCAGCGFTHRPGKCPDGLNGRR